MSGRRAGDVIGLAMKFNGAEVELPTSAWRTVNERFP
jgi:hypothetical protein